LSKRFHDYPCEECGADPGEPCENTMGEGFYHLSRAIAWVRDEAEEE